MPRFDRERVLLAVAVLTPPVLIGALANTLMALQLSNLEFQAPDTAGLIAALTSFKTSVELTTVSFFVIFGLATVAALHATEDAMKGMVAFSLATLLFLTWTVYAGWGFGTTADIALLGLGISFWGLGWVLIMVHLFALLRATPHRKWTWVTGGVGLYQAVAFFLTLELAVYASLEVAVAVLAVLGAAAGVVVFDRRLRIGGLWGYGLRRRVRLPEVATRRLLLVAVYALSAFGLIGATFQHHFDYAPRFELRHWVLLAATTPLGVALFGAVSERGGRRALLYTVPVTIGAALIVQNAFASPWPVALAEGIMLGSIPYLFQYLAEATKLLTRGTIFLFSMGAVATFGIAGSFVAQFRAWTAFTREEMLLFEFAVMIVALAVAPQLPETQAQVSEEEQLEDYLALARRVSAE